MGQRVDFHKLPSKADGWGRVITGPSLRTHLEDLVSNPASESLHDGLREGVRAEAGRVFA